METYTILQYHGKYNISKRTASVKYIIVHWTASQTSAAGNALNNCKYFAGGDRNGSAHYFIDDGNIYEYADPDAYYTWGVGDGHGKYGITNNNSINIEVCSKGADFTDEERKRLRFLVIKLMKQYGIDAAHVVRHYDASRKACPWPYTPNGNDPTGAKWAELHKYITTEDNDMTLKEVKDAVYRLANNKNYHLYTASYKEASALKQAGWKYEGIAWYQGTGADVTRLYNKSTGEHLYTLDSNEVNDLVRAGWVKEVGFKSGNGAPVYRLNSSSAGHLFTTSTKEVESCIKGGWTFEGVGFYAR